MLTNYARRFLVLSVLVGLLMAVLVMVTAVTAQPPDLPDTLDERASLPHWPQAEEAANSDDSILSPNMPEWSKGVHQSYHHGNWEIYSTHPPYRLTENSSSDIHPRFNRGATRVVFSSNRDGDYELYGMNANGAGVQMLTSNTAIDVNPIWSPDGSRIAFQSYRDGQSEIYVMNADGSGETRLTAHGNYDGDPSWSPDGSKIAFRSDRTGIPFIYVMNSNGTGVVQFSTQPSYYVAWSPDGSQIAYSADLDGDNFFELWLMNADGSNQRMIFDPFEEQQDAWARGWSPDGREITFTQIRFIQYQGNWYWERAYLYAHVLATDEEYQLDYGYQNWHPDRQTTDISSPQTETANMPAVSQIPDFRVNWSGVDQQSGAGLASYDVQYQVGTSGPWVDWQMGVTTTSAVYTAVPGTTVSFRARARDHAFNVENWPTVNNPTTTFYTWSLGGKLTDNRGIPITQAPLSVAPVPLNDAITDNAGNFFSRLKTEGSHTLDVNRSGYGNLAQTTLNMENLAHIYLPPANNVLQNGGFEAAQPLAEWTTTGTVTAVTSPRHTGTNSGLLGNTNCPYPCLTPEENLGFGMNDMDMAVDSKGIVHAVFLQSNGIVYANRSASGDWSSQPLSSESGRSPKLVVDQDDQLHVLWAVGHQIYYTHKSADNSWSSPIIVTTIANYPDYYSAYVNKLVVDSKGGLHVMIEERQNGGNGDFYPHSAFYLFRHPNGTWLTPVLLVEASSTFRYDGGLMGIGVDDSLHFIFIGQKFNLWVYDYWEDFELIYQRRLADGTWVDKQETYLFQSNLPIYPESMAVTAEGIVHMTWSQLMADYSIDTFHALHAANGEWSSPNLIQADTATYSRAKSHISADSQGQVHALLSDSTGNTFYRLWRPGLGWQGVILLTDQLYQQQLRTAVDQYDDVHLLVSTFPGASIFSAYFRSLPATTNSTAVLSQQVTIPAYMPAPTLAFMAQRPGDVPGDDSGLELLVSDGVTTTAVPLANGGAAWSHYWADMSHWAGQTVTVDFRLTQVSGDPRVRAAIDDVTLGSAYPDIWVSGGSPGSALPGETVVYHIEYGNRGRVAAAAGEVTVTWPDSLTFVSANITPTWAADTLSWSFADLAAESTPVTVVVTATVDAATPYWETINLPVSISSATSEVEQQNNQLVIPLDIMHRLFMPVLFKP